MKRTWMKQSLGSIAVLVGVLVGLIGALITATPTAFGQNLVDYTAYPNFLSQTVPPNILFIVDLSNATQPASYGSYPISFKSGTVTASQYASNVNLNGPGDDLVSSSDNGVTTNSATVGAPSDVFDAAKTYYGLFDPLRCYSTSSNSFVYGSVKASVSDACGSSYWDGNFLNWIGMRKKDVAFQVLVGGTAKPAQSNIDGTSDTLQSEDVTGENGTNNTCSTNSNPCWRYVKYLPDATLNGRVPTSLPADQRGGTVGPGRFFGSGEGKLYVNTDNDADPFDTAPGNQYLLQVDLRTEPDVPSGTGNVNDNCTVGDPNFAGHLICYKRDRSLGLFQKLRLDNMHVGVMFADATGGKAGRIQFRFDDNFNSSAITNIRNQGIKPSAPLAEATYEGLCLYRNSQGPCYNNSPVDFVATPGAQYDPFFFVSFNQTVRCCKSYILMISPGVPINDDNQPDVQTPFGNLFTGTQVGLSTTRLDDVAFYGQTHDIRDQTSNPGMLSGTQKVTFYAVNAMGGAAGASTLASAAKYGGFEDRNSNGTVDLTGQTCTYPVGSNLGTGTGTSNAEWDANQDCLPDTFFDASEGGDLETQVFAAIADILKRAASGTSVSVLATSSTGEGSLFQAFFYSSIFEGFNEIKWTGYTEGLFLDSFGNIREDTDGDGRLVYQNDNIMVTRLDTASGDVKVDRYVDSNGDGKADSSTPTETVSLREIKGIWEAGKQLALMASSSRKILTWVDTNNNGLVDVGEQIPFTTANSATLAPYLRAGTAPYTADNIINFIRGDQVTGLRDRQLTVSGSLKVWKLGDPIDSTPTIVSTPKERYDIIYGDPTYTAFFQQYRNRRQVAYVGANDGMLHAFNAGFYHRGDDPNTSSTVEHGWFTRTATDNSSGPLLGDELWGFIPYQLLPHLKWLTQTNYTHVYYVDLKPKVTDVRIFTPDADHPNGWGTILIGGFRMGGSCGNCQPFGTGGHGAPPMTVTANFGSGVQTRTFYSAYFVLDITNPEVDPKLLWVFSSSGQGLTTSYPAVLRVNPFSDARTSNTNAKWFAVFGSGPTGYDGSIAQLSKLYAVNLMDGPGASNSLVTTMPVGTALNWKAWMGDLVSLDKDLDYRTDTAYVGRAILIDAVPPAPPPPWRGKMYRLTTNMGSTVPFGGNTDPTTWGFGSPGVPTEVLDTFPCAPPKPCTGPNKPGPILAAPAVTLDDSGKIWVFFGTGRFYSAADKANTDTQYLIGVKDLVLSGACTQTSTFNCHSSDLVDVSSAQICVVCTGGTNQVTGVTGVTTFEGTGTTSLIGLVQSKDGWFTTLPTSKERALVSPTVLGGIVFFTTFVPVDDICVAAGDSSLYALFYQTGSAYKTSVIGTATSGGNTNVLRSISLGTGLAAQAAVHIGGQGSGTSGTGSSGGGCQSGTSLVIQASGATVAQPCATTGSVVSRYISWIKQRD